ncbi:unnamed protein product [Amoebophrya sp. A120]|nr:unnamed protein product [Amoebophrya sp. A120]|eukprot:GSA120T00009900001.1
MSDPVPMEIDSTATAAAAPATTSPKGGAAPALLPTVPMSSPKTTGSSAVPQSSPKTSPLAGTSAASGSSTEPRWLTKNAENTDVNSMPKILRPMVWRTKLVPPTHLDASDLDQATSWAESINFLGNEENLKRLEEKKVLFAHEESALQDAIGLERIFDLISIEGAASDGQLINLVNNQRISKEQSAAAVGESADDKDNPEEKEEKKIITLRVAQIRDTLSEKEINRRRRAVVSGLRELSKAEKIALRLGPWPRRWFIPDKIAEKSKKRKKYDLFPGSAWMKYFKAFGFDVESAKIHLITSTPPGTTATTSSTKNKYQQPNPPDHNDATRTTSFDCAIPDKGEPEAYLVIQYQEEQDLQTVANEFFGCYVQHTNLELRPSFAAIVDAGNPLVDPRTLYEQPIVATNSKEQNHEEHVSDMHLDLIRKEDREKKAKEQSTLYVKPQFQEVEVEETIAEEYGGVSTLGMREEQRAAFKNGFKKVKELEDRKKKLDQRLLELKKEEMLFQVRDYQGEREAVMKAQAGKKRKGEKRKRRKVAEEAPWNIEKQAVEEDAPWKKIMLASDKTSSSTTINNNPAVNNQPPPVVPNLLQINPPDVSGNSTTSLLPPPPKSPQLPLPPPPVISPPAVSSSSLNPNFIPVVNRIDGSGNLTIGSPSMAARLAAKGVKGAQQLSKLGPKGSKDFSTFPVGGSSTLSPTLGPTGASAQAAPSVLPLPIGTGRNQTPTNVGGAGPPGFGSTRSQNSRALPLPLMGNNNTNNSNSLQTPTSTTLGFGTHLPGGQGGKKISPRDAHTASNVNHKHDQLNLPVGFDMLEGKNTETTRKAEATALVTQALINLQTASNMGSVLVGDKVQKLGGAITPGSSSADVSATFAGHLQSRAVRNINPNAPLGTTGGDMSTRSNPGAGGLTTPTSAEKFDPRNPAHRVAKHNTETLKRNAAALLMGVDVGGLGKTTNQTGNFNTAATGVNTENDGSGSTTNRQANQMLLPTNIGASASSAVYGMGMVQGGPQQMQNQNQIQQNTVGDVVMTQQAFEMPSNQMNNNPLGAPAGGFGTGPGGLQMQQGAAGAAASSGHQQNLLAGFQQQVQNQKLQQLEEKALLAGAAGNNNAGGAGQQPGMANQGGDATNGNTNNTANGAAVGENSNANKPQNENNEEDQEMLDYHNLLLGI